MSLPQAYQSNPLLSAISSSNMMPTIDLQQQLLSQHIFQQMMQSTQNNPLQQMLALNNDYSNDFPSTRSDNSGSLRQHNSNYRDEQRRNRNNPYNRSNRRSSRSRSPAFRDEERNDNHNRRDRRNRNDRGYHKWNHNNRN
jgi:hypothetical protein